MRIYLVRHGESEANVNKALGMERADHTIGLTERGLKQAAGVADWLNERVGTARVWTSPYLRARQTAQVIYDKLAANPIHGPTWRPSLTSRVRAEDLLEDIALCEQQFGLFDGVPDWELATRFPEEHAHYQKYEQQKGRFYARMPLGESRFDVALRVQQIFDTFQRDAAKSKDMAGRDLIVVCHGVVIRAFIMRWCHKTPEWFEEEPNPKNCSVRLIDYKGEDAGYVYEGEQ